MSPRWLFHILKKGKTGQHTPIRRLPILQHNTILRQGHASIRLLCGKCSPKPLFLKKQIPYLLLRPEFSEPGYPTFGKQTARANQVQFQPKQLIHVLLYRKKKPETKYQIQFFRRVVKFPFPKHLTLPQ